MKFSAIVKEFCETERISYSTKQAVEAKKRKKASEIIKGGKFQTDAIGREYENEHFSGPSGGQSA